MRCQKIVTAVLLRGVALFGSACGGAAPSQPAPAVQPAPETQPTAQKAVPEVALPHALPEAAAAQAAMKADVDAICNVVERSGAAAAPPGERGVHTAVWLGSNVTSADGKAFLQVIQPLTGIAKADALDATARALGLTACPLSAEWRL